MTKQIKVFKDDDGGEVPFDGIASVTNQIVSMFCRAASVPTEPPIVGKHESHILYRKNKDLSNADTRN